MPRIALVTLIFLCIVAPGTAQGPNTEEWTIRKDYDDFTDELTAVSANIVSEDGRAAFAILCYPSRRSVAAMVVFTRKHLGSEDFKPVRWRVGQQPPGTDSWMVDDNRAFRLMARPRSHQIVTDILDAPDSATSLLFEVTDFDDDTHRGTVALTESKNTVSQVLETCEK